MADEAQVPADARLLSWEAFRVTFLDAALGAEIPITGEPQIRIFLDGGAKRLGLRVCTDEHVSPRRPLRSVTISRAGENLLVACENRELFQPFYALMMEIADRIQLRRESFTDAVFGALGVWRRMLAGFGRLTDDEQLGLSGELWTLTRLLSVYGGPSVAAWLGPASETHDFRIAAGEIEVKTTRGASRKHVISRVEQMLPSPGKRLFVLSLHFAQAGGGADGWTLAEQVDRVRTLLAADADARRNFDQLLDTAGWHDEDSDGYVRRWQMRELPRLVEVDARCPRLTPEMLRSAAGDLSLRLDHVTYRVNFEGLGAVDGSPAFTAILPEPPAG